MRLETPEPECLCHGPAGHAERAGAVDSLGRDSCRQEEVAVSAELAAVGPPSPGPALSLSLSLVLSASCFSGPVSLRPSLSVPLVITLSFPALGAAKGGREGCARTRPHTHGDLHVAIVPHGNFPSVKCFALVDRKSVV